MPSKLNSSPSTSRTSPSLCPKNSKSSYAKKSDGDREELGALGFEIKVIEPLLTPSSKVPVALVITR